MPSSIIAADEVPRGSPIVLWARVSESPQVRNGSLAGQRQDTLAGIRVRGLSPRAVVACCERGKLSEPRPEFLRAIESARRHGAGIVAANLSRLIRAAAFDKETNWQAIPSPEEIDSLLTMADGVRFLATIEPPNLPPSQVHSNAVRRGQHEAGNRGGRPSAIPERLRPVILREHVLGYSLQAIADRHGLTKSAVERWVGRWKKFDRPHQAYAAWLRGEGVVE